MSNAYQTPESNLVNENTSTGSYGSVEKAVQGDYDFSIGSVLSEAWAKTNGCKGVFNLSFFYYFLVVIVLMMGIGMVTAVLFSAGDMGATPDQIGAGQMPAGMMIMQFAIQFGVNLIVLPMVMGLMMIGIKRSVDAPISAGMIFKYFSKMIPLFITMLMVYIMVVIGLLLLVLPGIYLMIAYYMAMPLVVEKGMSPWQAMETSRKAITHRWFSVLGLFIVMAIIVSISVIPLGIGLIWTVPMMMMAFAILYRNMFGVEAETISE